MRLIVTLMKDEGPFMLEWFAHYIGMGFDHFIVNTNDCSDGTDAIADRLQTLGYVTHIDNPGPWDGGPQAQAYRNAQAHPVFAQADWVLVCDADEFLDIKTGDGTLDALFQALPDDTDAISAVWRLFGHNGRIAFEDGFVTEQFTRASHSCQVSPPQVRAVKTLFRNNGKFTALSTHRPVGIAQGRGPSIKWLDGNGRDATEFYMIKRWYSSAVGHGFGDDLVRMNHYAVRSLGSYLMKRVRGDVGEHAARAKMEDSGLVYWQIHCWNTVKETSIQRYGARTREIFDKLYADPVLGPLHDTAVEHHQARISALLETPAGKSFHEAVSKAKPAPGVTLAQMALATPEGGFSKGRVARYSPLVLSWHQRATRMASHRNTTARPWFAPLDALDAPMPEQDAELVAPDISVLRAGIDLTSDEQGRLFAPPRKGRAEQRTACLTNLKGKQGRWLLLNTGDPHLYQEILNVVGPSTLAVLAPWGMETGRFVGPRRQMKPNAKRRLQDKAYFNIVEMFPDELQSGKLQIIRAEPAVTLPFYPPATCDVVYVAGKQPAEAYGETLNRAAKLLRRGGVLVVDAYHRRGPLRAATLEAAHRFVGQNSADFRVRAVEGAHLLIEHLPPMPS